MLISHYSQIDYSSICCFVGTSRGNVATFKILPQPNGTYTAQFAGFTNLDDRILSLIPIDADSGGYTLATPAAVGGLRTGLKINGVVIAVTASGCRIFKPPASKGAHRSWDDCLCDAAAVVKTEGRGYSLVGLFGDGNARAFSIPALRDIGRSPINHIADMRRLSEACITPGGGVMTWVGPSEVGLFNVWGTGKKLYDYFISQGTVSILIHLPARPLKTVYLTPRKYYPLGQRSPTSSGSPAHNMSHPQTWIS